MKCSVLQTPGVITTSKFNLLNSPPPYTGGVHFRVLLVTLMTTYNIYSAYKAARRAGRKNIRFVSLQTPIFVGNPITTDNGINCVDTQSGDF